MVHVKGVRSFEHVATPYPHAKHADLSASGKVASVYPLSVNVALQTHEPVKSSGTALTKDLLSASLQVKQSVAAVPLAVKHDGCLVASVRAVQV